MIVPTKKRLARIFMSVIVVMNFAVFSVSYFVLHHSILESLKRHISEDIKTEFLDQYTKSGLTPDKKMWDEHHFQILNRQGDVVISTQDSSDFYPVLNRKLLADAFDGADGFEVIDVRKTNYLIYYFPLDRTYTGRVAASLAAEAGYERSFLKLILMSVPGMFILSYFASSFLVNRAMKPISEIFTFQETFSSNVSHELRSPLASLKGNFEVALRKERMPEEYREAIRSGLGETNRIINLLNNLSFLASSKFKPLDLDRKKADIGQILNKLVEVYKPVTASANVELKVSDIPDLACSCDESLIRRTMENLFDNAVKYTPPGGTIDVSLTKKGRVVVLRMLNSCEPLSRKLKDHLFEPFSRDKNSQRLNPGGKGLGLYISRYIARSHGGDLKVETAAGRVFSATLLLPDKG